MWFAFIVISITLMAVVALFLYIVSDSRKSGVPLETEVWTFFTFVIIILSMMLWTVLGL